MPYIKEEDRARYDELVDQLVEELIKNDTQAIKGHHNYIMFTLAVKLLAELGKRYATIQDIMGTFDCCKLEFYRRIAEPHENAAAEKNGDIKELFYNPDAKDCNINKTLFDVDIKNIRKITDKEAKDISTKID